MRSDPLEEACLKAFRFYVLGELSSSSAEKIANRLFSHLLKVDRGRAGTTQDAIFKDSTGVEN